MKKQPKPVLAWATAGSLGTIRRVWLGYRRDQISVYPWEQLVRVRIVPVKPKRRSKR